MRHNHEKRKGNGLGLTRMIVLMIVVQVVVVVLSSSFGSNFIKQTPALAQQESPPLPQQHRLNNNKNEEPSDVLSPQQIFLMLAEQSQQRMLKKEKQETKSQDKDGGAEDGSEEDEEDSLEDPNGVAEHDGVSLSFDGNDGTDEDGADYGYSLEGEEGTDDEALVNKEDGSDGGNGSGDNVKDFDGADETDDSFDSLEDDGGRDGGETEGSSSSWAAHYSQYATIVPDPEYQTQTQIKQDAKQKEAKEKWGAWHFWDSTEDERPTYDYAAAYPNRDVPFEGWPDEAWQVDAVFVNHLLDSAMDLVDRAKYVIYAEYGFERMLMPNSDEFILRQEMFKWEHIWDEKNIWSKEPSARFLEKGGWTSNRSMQGLSRRLLHAIMTNDEFVVAFVGGPDSAAPGNHFRQSYPMQFHRVMAPVLARLGVQLLTLNLSHRTKGTLTTAWGKTWGRERGLDLLVWDAPAETTRREKDLFLRQTLLHRPSYGGDGHGNDKVPMVLMGGEESDWELLKLFHDLADMDVGRFGTATHSIPVTNAKSIDDIPDAARYIKCDDETASPPAEATTAASLCQHPAPHDYCATCWIDRPDIDPKTLFPNITQTVPDQDSGNNPGWRRQQLTGRLLAFTILDALENSLETFNQGTMGGPPLDDAEWHMSDYYANIRDKLSTLSPDDTGCSKWGDRLPSRLCSVPLQGATQNTPRNGLSLLDILKTTSLHDKPSNPNQVMYEGYDVHNTCFDPPAGSPDIIGILSGRRRLSQARLDNSYLYEKEELLAQMLGAFARVYSSRRVKERVQSASNSSDLVTGLGWRIADELPGLCDGQYTSICGRQASITCPLLGHHDSRGQLQGDQSSGWLVFQLEDLRYGLVLLSVEPSVPRNNSHSTISGASSFSMDVSIGGKVTTWDKETFLRQYRPNIQPGVNILILLNDESFSNDDGVLFEIALRIRECEGGCTFGVSHVFWA